MPEHPTMTQDVPPALEPGRPKLEGPQSWADLPASAQEGRPVPLHTLVSQEVTQCPPPFRQHPSGPGPLPPQS